MLSAKLRSNTKYPSQFSRRVIKLETLLWIVVKNGVTLGIDHLYLLSLFDLLALHFWVLVWVIVKDLTLGSEVPFLGK